MAISNREPLSELPLVVTDLKVYYISLDGVVKVLPKLSFTLKQSEILGIFGESRSGKSVTALALLDLIRVPGYTVGGSVLVNGFNIFREVNKLARLEADISSGKGRKSSISAISEQEEIMQSLRGKTISMVTQDAHASLNPMLKIREQFLETMLAQSSVEIASSIINRENLTLEEVTNLADLVEQQPDLPGRNRMIRRWMTEHAIFSKRKLITNAFEYKAGQEDLAEEVFNIASMEKSGIDTSIVETVRDQFLLYRRSRSLRLDIIAANDEKDPELATDLAKDLNVTEMRLKGAGTYKKLLNNVLKSSKYGFMRQTALYRAAEILAELGVENPWEVMGSIPGDLSIVIRQKIAIALSFSAIPHIIVLDEPAGSFDPNTKLKILSFIKEQHRARGDLSMVIFSKDLALLSAISDRVLVMYAGNIVEEATSEAIIKDSKHPFTSGLINTFEAAERVTEKTSKLEFTTGFSPNLVDPPKGCRFHPRCKFRMDLCSMKKPLLSPLSIDQKVACFLYSEATEEER